MADAIHATFGRQVRLLTRCTNSHGVAQPDTPNWNPAGFMRNVVESMDIIAA